MTLNPNADIKTATGPQAKPKAPTNSKQKEKEDDRKKYDGLFGDDDDY